VTLLHPGDPFPELTVQLTDGRSLVVPEELSGGFGVVLFFRGAWCPYCNAQLRAFQRKSPALADVSAQVVALSADTEQDTAGLIDKHDLTFPVGYGADARHLAQLTGAFVNDDPLYVPSTGFVLDPDGRVIVSALLQRGHRPAGSRRRGRADPQSPREHGAGHRVSHAAGIVALDERASRGELHATPTTIFHRADREGDAR
jgi:peroxiredoxin